LVYKAPLTVTEWEATIIIGILIQKTNRFEKAPSSGKVAELISVYIIIPKEDDLQEPEETLKFTKASNWLLATTPKISKLINQIGISKISDSRISLWNTLNIPKNTPGINAIGLHEEEGNP